MNSEQMTQLNRLTEMLSAESRERVERILDSVKDLSLAELAALGMGLSQYAALRQRAEKGRVN